MDREANADMPSAEDATAFLSMLAKILAQQEEQMAAQREALSSMRTEVMEAMREEMQQIRDQLGAMMHQVIQVNSAQVRPSASVGIEPSTVQRRQGRAMGGDP